jgi:hypothetical protein
MSGVVTHMGEKRFEWREKDSIPSNSTHKAQRFYDSLS